MHDAIKTILEKFDGIEEGTLTVLGEQIETLIEEKANEKATLQIESALIEQDAEHADKFKRVIHSIDQDHSTKVEELVEAIDLDRSKKLEQVIEHYENEMTNVATEHRDQIVEKLSNYLEEYLDNAIPAGVIEEAASNKHAQRVLEQVRKLAAVDESFVSANIREAIVDGADQIDSLQEQVKQLKQKNLLAESKRIMAELTKTMPADQSRYVNERLANKTPKFIKENFEYVITMFEKAESKQKTSAINEAKQITVDRGQATVQDNTVLVNEATSPRNSDPVADMYLSGFTSGNSRY